MLSCQAATTGGQRGQDRGSRAQAAGGRRADAPHHPGRGGATGHRRGPRRAVDRAAGPEHGDEQERPLRPLRLEGGAPAGHDRRRGGGLRAEVLDPALAEPEGLPRLRALCERFLGHVERGVFPGGCFFASAAAELDTRPGPLRDRIAEVYDAWTGLLEENVRRAQELGELDASRDPDQLASRSTPCSPRRTASSCCGGSARVRDGPARHRCATGLSLPPVSSPGAAPGSGCPPAATPAASRRGGAARCAARCRGRVPSPGPPAWW